MSNRSDNFDAAFRSRLALAAVAPLTGREDPFMTVEGMEAAAADLIVDLLHLVRLVGGAPSAVITRAEAHFEVEVDQETVGHGDDTADGL